MVILEMKNIIKKIESVVLFELDQFTLYEGDKVGVIGANGSGKSTLLKMINGMDQEYKGEINCKASAAYVEQTAYEESDYLSGGEYTKEKIYAAIRMDASLVLLDEPTSNLDIKSILHLERQLLRLPTWLMVSHDEQLLEKTCNKILVIKDQEVILYNMGYVQYKERIMGESAYNQKAFDVYVKTKRQLVSSIEKNNKRARSIKKTPSRMGNSEARLHKRSSGEIRAKVEARSKHMASRLEQIESVDKPYDYKTVQIKVLSNRTLHHEILVQGRSIEKSFDNKVLFKSEQIIIENNKKTWIKGENACGKTTLIQMILQRDPAFSCVKGCKINYFDQKLQNLKPDLTLLETILETSSREEQEIRNLLGNFMFRRSDVYKQVKVLSGGEMVRLSLAKLILSDANLLILDEPTNYLDVETKEVLINALAAYDGAVLFVSHDRHFGETLADCVYEITKGKIIRLA